MSPLIGMYELAKGMEECYRVFLVCYERQLLKAENLDEELEDWCSEMQQPPKYQAKALL